MLKEKEDVTLKASDLSAYQAAHDGAAVMNRSAWGRVRMAGEDRIDFLHRMSTNEVRDLSPGMIRETVLTSDIARVVAVVTVHTLPDHLLLVTDPGGAERVVGHLQRYIFFRDHVELADVTSETEMLTLWGPQSPALLDGLTASNLAGLEPATFTEVTFDGTPAIVARTAGLVLDQYDLIVDRGAAESLFGRLTGAGADSMSAAVYEILRVEAGRPRQGQEMGEDFNPLEAGLKPIIDFDKGCYIGQEVVARLDTYDKVRQHLVGIKLEHLPDVAEQPDLTSEGERVGFLTSWVRSPAYGAIALGYVLSKYLHPGMCVEVQDAGGEIAGQVVALPFC